MQLITKIFIIIFVLPTVVGCKKLIEIQPPVGTLTAAQVFSSDAEALAAASDMYSKMINNTGYFFGSGGMTIFGGLSADELSLFSQTNSQYYQFQDNNLLSTNTTLNSNLWSYIYSVIYGANSIIEGLQNYSGVSDSVRVELTGEAEFVRGFCNFYLVNLFGGVPLVTTINYSKTSLLARASDTAVYGQIITDLMNAQNSLASDYSVGSGQRIVPNKWAATALLARVYLYKNQWENAVSQATAVIDNTVLYALDTDLNDIFLMNSSEAIWQLQQTNTGQIGSYNVTPEGYVLIPKNSTSEPSLYLSASLLDAFEPNDRRKSAWIDSTTYLRVRYYYPFKYKMGPSQAKADGAYSEYYMVLRLSEQYLIRAEAEANLGDLQDATIDLNVIRNRAGLPNTSAVTASDLLSAITHERQIELFAEWGHRWFDLKRTNQATTILSSNKEFVVNQNKLLFPIPVSELQVDPNLTQNPDY